MNGPYLILYLMAVSIVCLPSLTSCKDRSPTPAKTNRIQLWGNGYWFLLGVNYPWHKYGHDFGAAAWGHDGVSHEKSNKEIDADFAYLKSRGVHVVRWFLFGDCRASPEFDANGNVAGFDEYFYPDLDATLAIAEKHNIYLIPVLLDFHLADKAENVSGVQTGGRSRVITGAGTRKSFLDNALKPLLERYGENRNIIAWDVMNEPEGAMIIPGGKWVDHPVSAAEMQSFVEDVVGYIHTYSSQHATVGSASRRFLHYWTSSKLDFYQYHYYEKMEQHSRLDYPYAKLDLDKPCIVGEFGTKNTRRTMTQCLNTIWKNDYAGALAWSHRAGDEASDFKNVAGEFAAWSNTHETDLSIGPHAQPDLDEWR
ncbi:MAG: cellulase family glycosylhydrolase [Phycisphaerales bacterium]|nr:MAG: cellulase family glycosylhydrolase [Phycisphaerales bacterium]